MACDRVAHPYFDIEFGNHKHVGEATGGNAECASVVVTSNRANVEIQVSLPDDLGRQDGETEFCRSYHEVCPTEDVAFTAPASSGSTDTAFFRWVIDGVPQEDGLRLISLDACDGQCHSLRAVYGPPIVLEDGCWFDIEVPTAGLIQTAANYTQPFCPGGPSCPSNMTPYFPQACWNTLWPAWNNGVFEIEFAGVFFNEFIGYIIEWTTRTVDCGETDRGICSPAILANQPFPCDDPPGSPFWCRCEVGDGCISPIIECTIPAWCTGNCASQYPRNGGTKWWTQSWTGYSWMWCRCGLDFVKIFWVAQVAKGFCQRGNQFDCCTDCIPPGPGCGCPCNLPDNGMTIDFGTPIPMGPSSPDVISFEGSRIPGEDCSVALQRLFDRIISDGSLAWEGDRTELTYPSGVPGNPTPECEVRRQESLTVEF